MEYLLYALDDVMGLKGFPIVFEDLLIHLDAGLSPDMAGELAGKVVLDGDLTLGPL
jgi:hypothetical protein